MVDGQLYRLTKLHIKAAGAGLLYSPSYSSDVNPIGADVSKHKTFCAKLPRMTVPGLWERIGTVFVSFTPLECQSRFLDAVINKHGRKLLLDADCLISAFSPGVMR